MNKKFQNLPLRSGVGIVVLNNENKVFVAKRIDNPKIFWQMPQGGVDKGEDFYTCALRELKEETSIVSVKLIKLIKDVMIRDLPIKKIKLNTNDRKYFKILEDWIKKNSIS